MKAVIRHTFALGVLLTGLTGIAYPLVAAGVGHTIFPIEAIDELFEDEHEHISTKAHNNQYK